jgi:hypothetical protein
MRGAEAGAKGELLGKRVILDRTINLEGATNLKAAGLLETMEYGSGSGASPAEAVGKEGGGDGVVGGEKNDGVTDLKNDLVVVG